MLEGINPQNSYMCDWKYCITHGFFPQNWTKEDIGEVIVLEQFLRMLAPDLQIWIKERDPKTATEPATFHVSSTKELCMDFPFILPLALVPRNRVVSARGKNIPQWN